MAAKKEAPAPERADLLEKEPTQLHKEFAEWLTEVTGYQGIDLKTVQLVTVLRMKFQASETNRSRNEAAKEEKAAAVAERAANKEINAAARAAKAEAKAAKVADRESAKATKAAAAEAKAAAKASADEVGEKRAAKAAKPAKAAATPAAMPAKRGRPAKAAAAAGGESPF